MGGGEYDDPKPSDFSVLERLPRLRRLHVHSCHMPASLSALTGLQELLLDGCFDAAGAMDTLDAGLEALARLTSL